MIFDEITLFICGALILFSVLSALCNPFFRWKVKIGKDDSPQSNALPPVTVLIAVNNGDAMYLEKNLASLLAQEYPAKYQVVVIIEKNDSDSADMLKRYNGNDKLYSTYIPDTSRYMSRKKLAVTIGVKAAKYEWVILTDSFSSPVSNKWLATMAANFNDNNLVIGYSGYDKDARHYYRFERLRAFCYMAREAKHRSAYRANGANLAFRKSNFMEKKGYQGNLELVRGEYDFIANKYSQKKQTAIELSPKAWVRDDSPSKHTWRHGQLLYLETRKHLRRGLAHRALYDFDMLMMYVDYIAIIATLAYSVAFHNWTMAAAAGLALVITIILRVTLAKRVINQFDEGISAWLVIPYELSLIWHTLSNFVRYRLADKYDFTSHKL